MVHLPAAIFHRQYSIRLRENPEKNSGINVILKKEIV